MENTSQRDFLDICYAYGINSQERRHDFRSAILGYLYDYDNKTDEPEDMKFDGTTSTLAKQISDKDLIDQLDAFTLG